MYNLRLTRVLTAALLAGGSLAAYAGAAVAADGELRIPSGHGAIIIPSSSQAQPGDAGVRAHTNIRILAPTGSIVPNDTAPSGIYENPASLACLYGLAAKVAGCNPTTLTAVATGGSKVVAIVDAYDYPTAVNDLTVFSQYYGLPAITSSNFQIAYGAGVKPKRDATGGWELEEALDIEMAHAMAPGAKVILVEAASNSFQDLIRAEVTASKLVAAAGGGEVSNSWSGSELSNEETLEKYFATPGVVYFASSGDAAGIGFPAALSNVVAVGGTSVVRTPAGVFQYQAAWSSTGGGSSAYVPTPAYQSSISSIVGTQRGTPDVSLVADPNTGVWVYDTTRYFGSVYQWLVLGGTSVAAPATAGLFNNAGHFFASTPLELAQVYANKAVKADYSDVTKGSCGSNGQTTNAVKGWDFCTGVGTPYGRNGK